MRSNARLKWTYLYRETPVHISGQRRLRDLKRFLYNSSRILAGQIVEDEDVFWKIGMFRFNTDHPSCRGNWPAFSSSR